MPIRFITYGSIHLDVRGEYVGSESKTVVGVLCEIEQHVVVRPSHSVEVDLVQSVAVFGIKLSGDLRKLILVAHVREHYYVLGVKRHVPAEASSVEYVLRDKYDSDVPMMTAFREEIVNVTRISLVQNIIQNTSLRPSHTSSKCGLPLFLCRALLV